jgi:hypothetical protein
MKSPPSTAVQIRLVVENVRNVLITTVFVKISPFMSSDCCAFFLQKMIARAMIVLSQTTPGASLPVKHTQGEEVHGQKNKRIDRRQLRRILHGIVKCPAADGSVHSRGHRQ